MRILPALSSAALAAGCALGPVHIHRGVDASDHLEYLVRALTADTQQRESLWQAALKEPVGDEASLHRALLRTVPGHSGYDLAAAEAELQDLLSHSPNADVAPVARARLEDLHLVNGCRQEVEGLKRRLSKVADIERRLDQERK
jgi:hypothetical protein